MQRDTAFVAAKVTVWDRPIPAQDSHPSFLGDQPSGEVMEAAEIEFLFFEHPKDRFAGAGW
ncbi:hypothetical protein ASD99_31325 [Mesorhizobium sp. Root695]|nr:hypothetical protein ASD12_31880 [Mesorhizobium sp. Root102]KRB18187.1 hypothetical protein ASD99_31325 [Mesorhizobium sp. Root695]